MRQEGLEAKLRRFNNYRRVLYTYQPGPQAQLSEEIRWFRDNRSDVADNQVGDAEDQKTDPKRKDNFPNNLREDSQNESVRIEQSNRLDRDSSDSAKCLRVAKNEHI